MAENASGSDLTYASHRGDETILAGADTQSASLQTFLEGHAPHGYVSLS